MLGLVTFYTAATDLQAWTVPVGTPAHAAAGRIHTDFQRGFIRAEVVAFDDLVAGRLRAPRPGARAAARRGPGLRGPRRRRDPLPVQRLSAYEQGPSRVQRPGPKENRNHFLTPGGQRPPGDRNRAHPARASYRRWYQSAYQDRRDGTEIMASGSLICRSVTRGATVPGRWTAMVDPGTRRTGRRFPRRSGMSRSIRTVLAAIVVIAAASPAFAEFTGAAERALRDGLLLRLQSGGHHRRGHRPQRMGLVERRGHAVARLVRRVSKAWARSRAGATRWSATPLERFVPVLGGTNAVVTASPQLLVCRAAPPGPDVPAVERDDHARRARVTRVRSCAFKGCCRKA